MTTARRQRRHPLIAQMMGIANMMSAPGAAIGVSYGQGQYTPRHGKLKGWQKEFRRSNDCKNKMKPKG